MTTPRTRNRSSAKKAGTRFETSIAGYLAAHVDDRIERRARNGTKDRGDISGVRTVHGQRVVIECKDTTRLALGVWAAETELERGNDDALVGLIVHKRRGVGDPGQQWVTMTVDDLVTPPRRHTTKRGAPMLTALIITGYALVGFAAACLAAYCTRNEDDLERVLIPAAAFLLWPIFVEIGVPILAIYGVVALARRVSEIPERRKRAHAEMAADRRKALQLIRDEYEPGTASHVVAVEMLKRNETA